MSDFEPRFVIYSQWMNDAGRDLAKRAMFLLDKSYPNRRYIWNVGDSKDSTYGTLMQIAAEADVPVEIITTTTGIEPKGNPDVRVEKLSQTMTRGFRRVVPSDHYYVFHESDLISPTDLLERFVWNINAGREFVGTFPYTPSIGHTVEPIFHDTWAYRKDGEMFSNFFPYHKDFPRDWTPFEVDSVGSCWCMPAFPLLRMTIERLACIETCRNYRALGYEIWMDPSIRVMQPDYWTWDYWQHAEVE